MSTTKSVSVTITGAAGQIGYALLFRIASGQMFGPNTKVNLRLLELEAALPALNGVAMELDDCAFPLLQSVTCTSDLKQAFEGTNWALLVGSIPRKDGMERADLLKVNGGIFRPQGQAINSHAASDVRVLVVGNPCNTNALIAMKNAPDVPASRFFALTQLDENRARSMLAKKAGVSVAEVSRMTIWGNHSATQYPDFYNARIQGHTALEAIKDENWLQTEFIPRVQKRGAEVIKARGASSAASAANAVVDQVRNLVTPTASSQDWFSVCLASQGEYGVDPGLIFSFPTQITASGETKVVEGLTHNDFGKQRFQATLDELRAERDAVKSMELI